jgi:hypothetical protein
LEHAVQRGIFSTNSAFALGPRKTTETLIELAKWNFELEVTLQLKVGQSVCQGIESTL